MKKPTFDETLVQNLVMSRQTIMDMMLDPKGRNIDKECGYPEVLSAQVYRELYEREGIAARVVSVFPEESWANDPEVVESEDGEDTPFEALWKKLADRFNVYHFLERVDELSGIGAFGLLLIGVDDGEELDQPLEGVMDGEGNPIQLDDETMPAATKKPKRKMIYLRAFDESVVQIAKFETEPTNPRYGLPVLYRVTMNDPRNQTVGENPQPVADITKREIHWTRVIHVADNRSTSEVYGTPRMKNVFNRLFDLRKVLSSSAEMFWKGGFPGYSFEVNPDLKNVSLDKEALRKEFERYSSGLDRYLALVGVSAKSLAPQVADPSNQMKTQIQAICISKGIPQRIFTGSEEAKLAANQDSVAWNRRVNRRQEKYVTPMIIRPFVDRLILIGVLTAPASKEYYVSWPDLGTPSDKEKSEVATAFATAISLYVQAGADALIGPREFFTVVLGMDSDVVDGILKSAANNIDGTGDADEETIVQKLDKAAQAAKAAGAPPVGDNKPGQKPLPGQPKLPSSKPKAAKPSFNSHANLKK